MPALSDGGWHAHQTPANLFGAATTACNAHMRWQCSLFPPLLPPADPLPLLLDALSVTPAGAAK